MLADVLAQPAETGPEHREFEALERVGGWERVIAWAQARQIREMTAFMHLAEARNLRWVPTIRRRMIRRWPRWV